VRLAAIYLPVPTYQSKIVHHVFTTKLRNQIWPKEHRLHNSRRSGHGGTTNASTVEEILPINYFHKTVTA
jgi:hypothetical protein